MSDGYITPFPQGGRGSGKKMNGAATPKGAGPLEPKMRGFDLDEMNDRYALVMRGSKAFVLQEQDDGPTADRVQFVSIDAFKAWFQNRKTEVAEEGRIKTVSWAQAWLSHPQRREYRGLEFYPTARDETGTPGYFNYWRGFITPKAKRNGWKTLRDHILTNICGGDQDLYKWVFGWMASLVQQPRARPGTAIVLRGGQGAGKSILGQAIASLMPGHALCADSPRYITGNFNAHMSCLLFLQADEACWAGDKDAEGRLKGLVTSGRQMIEAKGIDPIQCDNYVRVLLTSNNRWVVPAGLDERRFAVFDISDRCKQNHGYFLEIEEELSNGGREALLHDLLAFDISTVDVRRIPKTAALLEQKIQSLDPITAWWLDRLKSGDVLRDEVGWTSEVPTNRMVDDYVRHAERVGVRRRSTETELGIALRDLVPGLHRRRASFAVEGFVRRPWCYVLPPLAECRRAFNAHIDQPVAWDDPGSEPDDTS